MIVVILRGLVVGVVGGAVLLAGTYALVLFMLWLRLLTIFPAGAFMWGFIAPGLFLGFWAVVLIVVGWRVIRTFRLPPP